MKSTLIAALLGGLLIAPVHAQNYPDRPIRLVVPFAAGGPTDYVARTIGEQMASTLGQPIIVENKPGADSTLGTDAVAKAAPDGYTILFTTSSLAINQSVYEHLSYDSVKDFAHIGLVGTQYLVLTTPNKFPAQSFSELIETLKLNPRQYNYGTSGGTIHLISEMFHDRIGLKNTERINYRGNAPMLVAYFTGDLHYGFLALDSAVPHIKEGKLKPVAVTSPDRDPALPDIPTMKEVGVEDFEVGVWFSIAAPKGTPEPIVHKLNQALNKALKSDQVIELSRRSAGYVLAKDATPEETTEFVRKEVERWAPVVKSAGITPS